MDAFRIPDGNPSLAVSMRDIPYRVTNGRELRALLYRPAGEGLFPAVVCVHGGAWVSGDRTATQGFAEVEGKQRGMEYGRNTEGRHRRVHADPAAHA